MSKRGRINRAKVDATTDADIRRQIAADPDTAPEFTDAMLAAATWTPAAKKVPIALRVDPDVLAYFKQQGAGYQSRMNAVLESWVRACRAAGSGKGQK